MRRTPVGLVLGLSLFFGTSSAAVRVHFVSGGSVTGDRAWADGPNLLLESGTGTVGFPLELVTRVESVDEPPGTLEPRPSAGPPGSTEPRGLGQERLEEAVAALRGGDVDRAALLFHRALQDSPERTDVRVGYALAEMARGRDPIALSVVLDGLVSAPDDPGLLEVLGDLRNREERVDDALRAWRDAARADPLPRLEEKILRAERELEAGRDYAFSATAHFTVRHDGDLDRAFSGAIEDFLEEQWVDLTSAFRHAPSQPVTVILYPERAFRDVTQTTNEVAGLYDGKIRIPLGGLHRIDPALERVLRHELTHAIVHSKTRGRAPRWLQEGLAQWSEPRPLPTAQVLTMRGAILAGEPATWDKRAFSYPAALSFVLWLESERGFSALVSALDHLGEGVSIDAALSAAYGQGYADLCNRWADSLKRTGGR